MSLNHFLNEKELSIKVKEVEADNVNSAVVTASEVVVIDGIIINPLFNIYTDTALSKITCQGPTGIFTQNSNYSKFHVERTQGEIIRVVGSAGWVFNGDTLETNQPNYIEIELTHPQVYPEFDDPASRQIASSFNFTSNTNDMGVGSTVTNIDLYEPYVVAGTGTTTIIRQNVLFGTFITNQATSLNYYFTYSLFMRTE